MMNYTRWSNPFLGEKATSLFEKNYPDFAIDMDTCLEDAPKEIALLSRLLIYLQMLQQKEEDEV